MGLINHSNELLGARKSGSEEIIDFLIQYGADVMCSKLHRPFYIKSNDIQNLIYF